MYTSLTDLTCPDARLTLRCDTYTTLSLWEQPLPATPERVVTRDAMHKKLGGSLGKNVTKELGISSLDSGTNGCWEFKVGSQVHQHVIYSSLYEHIHVSNQLFIPNLALFTPKPADSLLSADRLATRDSIRTNCTLT